MNAKIVPRKLRISHVLVQPILVWDDGKELIPGPETNAVAFPINELPTKERLLDDLKEVAKTFKEK